MARYRLVIGNKNYSSWSLRPWLFLRHHRIEFDELRLPLDSERFQSEIWQLSPSGRVPVLHDGGRKVWDSLAILEYLAEAHPQAEGWPADVEARALARCIGAEMHAGFADLRSELPMNCRRRSAAPPLTAFARRDVDRVQAIWRQARGHYGDGGPFLFGPFGIADAMYAPVASRFLSYGIDLDPVARAYVEAIHAMPAMQQWQRDAAGEAESIGKYEAVGGV